MNWEYFLADLLFYGLIAIIYAIPVGSLATFVTLIAVRSVRKKRGEEKLPKKSLIWGFGITFVISAAVIGTLTGMFIYGIAHM